MAMRVSVGTATLGADGGGPVSGRGDVEGPVTGKLPGSTRATTYRVVVSNEADVDVVVVGAGFAGIYALHKFRSLGLTTRVFEAAPEVGGTWYFNRYPGARCDVESVDYCYSFSDELQQQWSWSEKYATQAEILRYLNWVVDALDLRDGITFNTRVTSAVFDDTATALDSEHRHGRVGQRTVLRHGDGTAVGGADAGLPGPGHVRRRGVPHRALAGTTPSTSRVSASR